MFVVREAAIMDVADKVATFATMVVTTTMVEAREHVDDNNVKPLVIPSPTSVP